MEEIRPGLLHWTAFRDTIGADVHSYLHTPSGTLPDLMEPLQRVGAVPRVERIVLTNRHHYRDSDRFHAAFGCPVPCHEAGLHEFDCDIDGFAWGDELARAPSRSMSCCARTRPPCTSATRSPSPTASSAAARRAHRNGRPIGAAHVRRRADGGRPPWLIGS